MTTKIRVPCQGGILDGETFLIDTEKTRSIDYSVKIGKDVWRKHLYSLVILEIEGKMQYRLLQMDVEDTDMRAVDELDAAVEKTQQSIRQMKDLLDDHPDPPGEA